MVTLAGFSQGAIGFAFGMISVAGLSLLIGVKGAVPVVAILALLTNGSMVWRHRRSIVLRDAAPLLAGAALTAPLGVLLLRKVPGETLMTVLGVVIVVWVFRSLRTRQGEAVVPFSRRSGAILGLASGLLGGAFSSGGPPAVAWVSTQPWSSAQIRGTLATLFGMTGLLQVSLLAGSRFLGRDELLTCLLLSGPALVGSFVGARVGDRIPAPIFRRVMLLGLACVGVVFVVKGLRP